MKKFFIYIFILCLSVAGLADAQSAKSSLKESDQAKVAKTYAAAGGNTPQNEAPRQTTASELPSVEAVLKAFARSIVENAQAQKVNSISVVSFQSNGGQCDDLTAQVRSLLLEQLVNTYSDKIGLYDRENSKAVATESGLSMNGEQLTSSQAILVGEVFSAPGDSIGYVSYRLFRATDTAILAAGCSAVSWGEEEMELLNGSVSTPSRGSLPLINDAELEKVAADCKNLTETGVAMGQSGAQSSENTLPKRMAYAQIIPVLLQNGVRLFEREFFQLAARETSLSQQEAMPGHVKAIGVLGSISSRSGKNNYMLQISTIPDGRSLRAVNLAQSAGSAAGSCSTASTTRTTHNSANDFGKYMDSMDAKYREVQLEYECEVVISDEYTIPEKYLKEGGPDPSSGRFYCYEEYGSNFLSTEVTSAVIPARKLFEDKAHEWYKESNGNRKVIANKLANAAMWGIVTRNAENKTICYAGPLSLCIIEVNKKVRVPEGARVFSAFYYHPCYSLFDPYYLSKNTYQNIEKSIMQGTMEGPNGAAFHYSSSIEWKDGLPWKVKARIDLSPIKDKLLKKE